jgi:NADPH2:quinone reductase
LGSYAAGRLYPANRLVKLPDAISFEDAAAVVFKGITAQYLIKSTFPVGPGRVVLLYGAAGALGQLLAPWAKHLGASVVGVVSKEASVARAKAAGCDHVLVWSDNLPADVARVTSGHKADVIYDGIGRKTFAASLDSLHQRGTLVSIGASSGSPPPVEVGTQCERFAVPDPSGPFRARDRCRGISKARPRCVRRGRTRRDPSCHLENLRPV